MKAPRKTPWAILAKSLKSLCLLCLSFCCLKAMAFSSSDSLSEALQALTSRVLPSRQDREAKVELLRRVEAAAKRGAETLWIPLQGLQVYPFGSSVNACGEASSDVDVTLWSLPLPEGSRLPVPEILRRMAEEAPELGLEVIERRFSAKIPVLVLGFSYGAMNLSSDVSAFHLLPVYNTKLLRTYVELVPELTGLVIAVKRWAKQHGLAKTWENYISSYSWTLMVIFYLQVKHELPSLHALHEAQNSSKLRKASYAFDFLDNVSMIEDKLPSLRKIRAHSLGDFFRGFFRYYSEEFRWDSQVVSVRRGEIARRGSFNPKLFQGVHPQKAKKEMIKWLTIEDPIESYRNLNFALTESTAFEIMERINQTHRALEAGASLLDILPDSSKLITEALLDTSQQFSENCLEGFLPYPQLTSRQPCRCYRCQQSFTSYQALMIHQRPPMRCNYPFRCTLCRKGFLRKVDLEAHTQASHEKA